MAKYTLTKEDIEVIEEILDNLNGDAEIRTDYSGRGMFGKSCFGIVTSIKSWNIGIALNQDMNLPSGYSLGELFHCPPNSDSMGQDSRILYWPNIQVEDEGEDVEGTAYENKD